MHIIDYSYDYSHGKSPTYLSTLGKHSHVNSKQLMITVYKIHYLIQSRSIRGSSLFINNAQFH